MRSIALAAVIAAVARASPAAAAACCMSATSYGVGRLLIWEDFAVGASTSAVHGVGYWDERGEWRPYRDHYSDVEWRSEVWGLVGLDRRTSLYGRVPWALIHRTSPQIDGLGTGLGDVQVGVRYEVLSIGEIAELPALALSAGVVAPTGRSMQEARAPLGADATGRGVWAISAGASLEKTHLPYFVRLDLGGTYSLPAAREGQRGEQQFGPSGLAALAAGLEVAPGWVLTVIGRLSHEGALTLDGQEVRGSDRTDAGAGLAASWRFDDHWTTQAALSSGVFADGLGDNQPGRVTSTLGLRYGYF